MVQLLQINAANGSFRIVHATSQALVEPDRGSFVISE